jgi:hypothetical protein
MIEATMNDICTYTIQLRGQVNENEINALGPLQITVEKPGRGPHGSPSAPTNPA